MQEVFWNNSIEIIDSKYSSVQLAIIKSGIKDLHENLLNKIKWLTYQVALKVLLSKYKENADR